ncbi:unnamed protein product, partial [marine sediment metagenome]
QIDISQIEITSTPEPNQTENTKIQPEIDFIMKRRRQKIDQVVECKEKNS